MYKGEMQNTSWDAVEWRSQLSGADGDTSGWKGLSEAGARKEQINQDTLASVQGYILYDNKAVLQSAIS